ncbi:hypothetical protein Q1695_012210 [Nippostrongylus brasiliensis]|nr:hypothetical protein Q1695_012210 [Nippostrongylus brasiliensis]
MGSNENDQYEQLGPGGGAPPPPPPPAPAAAPEPKKDLPARTPGATILGQFALRPGDDVDLSSERGTTIGSGEGKKSKEGDKTSAEKDGANQAKPVSIQMDIKPYREPVMLKICYTVTVLLLIISFLLMALTVVQFIDLFVWLPVIFGE